MTTASHQAQEAYDRLIDKIFSGEFSPGAKLIERDLAADLKVSRMPVRIALSQMVVQGIVVGGQKQRSVRVREYSPDEVAQLYQFREVVECGAVRAAAERASGTHLAELDRLCDDMAAEVGQRRFRDRWANLDQAFHEAIARATGNEWFVATNKLLLRQTHYIFYRQRWDLWTTLPNDKLRERMQAVVDAHRKIVKCIRLGDADGAEQAMRRHVRVSHRQGSDVDAEKNR